MKNRYLLPAIQLFALLYLSLTGSICYADGIRVSDESARIDIYSDDAVVYYLITDPQGRRIGYLDPSTEIEEFPASFGFSMGIRDEISEKFHNEITLNLIPGTYTIEVIGVDPTTYSVSITISRRNVQAGFSGFDFDGIIDKGQTSKYQFTYTSDPTKPAGTATKIVSPSTLKQDIKLSRKMDWIDNDGVMNSLLKKAEAIEASIAKGNKTAAKNQLNAFINEIKAQACVFEDSLGYDCQTGKHIRGKFSYDTPSEDEYGKAIPAGQEQFLYAVKLLLDDAEHLLRTLK